VNRTVRFVVLGLILALLAIPLSSVISDWYFARSANQIAILHQYFPHAPCGEAKFDAVEIEDSVFDYRYQFRISGSDVCYQGLKQATEKFGYHPGDANSALADDSWLVAPKKNIGVETVALKFLSDKKTILWLRDKT
jgi:hypothetical protein